ncbi:hypothetical protein FVA74_08150 [Salinibacterium sp. dk2585]|uniref:hypothetical protein n=1 Tax=unclassified Salinibacterium TaxID=2632331 RepID=UPI0011C2524C|nr:MULTISPECIES: hypothetical protein [unclassified Salinibacterium]QEE61550.1 hypothetical protein FVA74_08150 [Salinibacterium sp. dk2585]TXK52481.1 hypothetical protein FVP63_12940 [Salinibacterium sp. dk5596]
MMLIALLFVSVGVADIARERFRKPAGPLVGAVAGTTAAVLVALGLGIPLVWSVAVVGVMLAWVASTALPSSGQSSYLKLAILGVSTVAAWAFPVVQADHNGAIASWYRQLPYGIVEEVSLETFVLAVASVLLLVETSNIIVRLILAAVPRAASTSPPPAPPTRRSWFSLSREPAVSPAPTGELPLKGGRILGPFERVFLFALIMAGQFTALAALVAAKGIIRFPEISKDTAHGSKAEYFLVGSFASWGVVLAVAVLLYLTSNQTASITI